MSTAFTDRFQAPNLLSLPSSADAMSPASFGENYYPRFQVDPEDEMRFLDTGPMVSLNLLADENECCIVVRWVQDSIGFALVRDSDTMMSMYDLRLFVYTAGSPETPIMVYHEQDMAKDPELRYFVLAVIGHPAVDMDPARETVGMEKPERLPAPRMRAPGSEVSPAAHTPHDRPE